MSVVCCQVEVSASGLSLVQRSPTEWVCVCVWSWNPDNEKALVHWGLLRYGGKEIVLYSAFCIQKSRIFPSTLSISLIPQPKKNLCPVGITVSELTSVLQEVFIVSRSQWPRGLRRRSGVARLLGLRVRILPGSWILVPCICCVLYRYWSLRRADPSSRRVLPCGECVSLIVIRCYYIPLHQWVGWRGQIKKNNSQTEYFSWCCQNYIVIRHSQTQQLIYLKNLQLLHNYATRFSHCGENRTNFVQEWTQEVKENNKRGHYRTSTVIVYYEWFYSK